MPSNIEDLYMCLFAIHISSLVNCSTYPCSNWMLVFCWIWVVLYIFWTWVLWWICGLQIFSPSWWLSFSTSWHRLLRVNFFFWFWWNAIYQYFFLWIVLLVSYPRALYLSPLWRFPPMFFSKSFRVLLFCIYIQGQFWVNFCMRCKVLVKDSFGVGAAIDVQ